MPTDKQRIELLEKQLRNLQDQLAGCRVVFDSMGLPSLVEEGSLASWAAFGKATTGLDRRAASKAGVRGFSTRPLFL
jgi:hypothetical protein